MASTIILSDNGVSSGSAGIKTTGGNDGTLLLQTTTSGGTATTALSIDASQNVTFTNQPTYSGGTANGVAYLNGSKVLTTGSALQFNGTNLGVGVTPSSWNSAYKVVQMPASSYVVGGNNFWSGANFYYDATDNPFYVANGYASAYQQVNGQHRFYNAASGTAAGAISFTQAMTLDASGNLGIGTNAPGVELDVVKSSSSGSAGVFPAIRVLNSLATQGDNATTYNYARVDIKSGNGTVFGDVATRYDTGFSGMYLGTESNHAMYFQTNGTERIRITTAGGVSFGATGTAYGSSGQVLTSAGNAPPTWSTPSAGLPGILAQVFTTSGTFTIPSSVTAIKVTVVGGGGGGGGVTSGASQQGGGGGGGGGIAVTYLTGLTPGNTLAVTIGAAGTATAAASGGTGGTSSVASGTQTITTISATGGVGGSAGAPSSGASGGLGSGGTFNIYGGYGGTGVAYSNGCTTAFASGGGGGAANGTSSAGSMNSNIAFGSGAPGLFGGRGGSATGSVLAVAGNAASGYGTGGGGAAKSQGSNTAAGGVGTAGIVVFEW